MRVLAVDDDPSVRGVVRAGLDPIEVVEASDGPSAVDVLRSQRIDVVLLDVKMPGMDGFATLRHIRREDRCGEPAVLMLTGRASEVDHVAAYRLGAHGYLTKPIEPEELGRVVKDIAERTVEEREALRLEELRRSEFLQRLEQRFRA